MTDKAPHNPFLRVIAIFKMVKSFTFICAGVGLLHFLHRDMQESIIQLMDDCHVDSDNHLAKWVLEGAAKVTQFHFLSLNGVGFLSAIAFFYATLFGIEGIGLWLRRRWAEWMVVILTSTLLPLEIYEILHHFTWAKVALMAGNLIILFYLIHVIREKQKE